MPTNYKRNVCVEADECNKPTNLYIDLDFIFSYSYPRGRRLHNKVFQMTELDNKTSLNLRLCSSRHLQAALPYEDKAVGIYTALGAVIFFWCIEPGPE